MAHVPAAVRRAQIVEAATAVIARDGVAGTTTRAIAGEAGLSLATLHYVFAGKDEVLAAVLEALLEEGKRALEASTPQAGDAPIGLADALYHLARTYWQGIRSDPGTQRVQYELTLYAMRTPQAAHLGRALYEYYLEATETLIRDACERAGETPRTPVRDLAHLAVSGIDGILLQYLVLDDDEQARRSLDNLIHGILALATAPESSGQRI
ncbi:TetR/AcrR family transcriptional regulator [Nocardia sp. NPDC056100]|uniref:TetR/AcrR family transcriptional regulator n=1 Tax=Nocardia sp. NPDC056100 TaxID=3345712 RepID=UPI0035DD44CF